MYCDGQNSKETHSRGKNRVVLQMKLNILQNTECLCTRWPIQIRKGPWLPIREVVGSIPDCVNQIWYNLPNLYLSLLKAVIRRVAE